MAAQGKPSLSVAIGAAGSIVLLRLLLFMVYPGWQAVQTAFIFAPLFLLIPLAIYALWPRGEGGGFMSDVLLSLRLCLLYSILVVLALALYYHWLDSGYFGAMRSQIIAAQQAASPQVAPELIRERIDGFFTIRNFTVVLLLLYLVLSLFYSVLFSAIKRVVIRPS